MMESVKREPTEKKMVAAISGLLNDEEQINLVAERVLTLCQENEGGVTNRVLDQVFSGVRPEMRALVINKLLSQNKIEILTKGDQLLYRVGQSDKVKNDEERVVYSIIENAGNKGIWTKDIRFKCNISMLALNKVLKQMESKKLIKSVKSVTASKKKLYMLYELEPDVSVTGGTWYSNQDFEAEFVDVLNQQCLRFLQEKRTKALQNSPNDPLAVRHLSYANLGEVLKFIKELGISRVELSEPDIETLLETLVFDGKAESQISVGSADSSNRMDKLYRACSTGTDVSSSERVADGLLRVPCGGCPVIRDCQPGAVISPSSCIYLTQWLDF